MNHDAPSRARTRLVRIARPLILIAALVVGTIVVADPALAVSARCTSGVSGPKALSSSGIFLYGGNQFAKGSYCEVGNSRLYMQLDGNLVLYDIPSGNVLFAANTVNQGARALFQTDGNFVVYTTLTGSTKAWASNTCCLSSILEILPADQIRIRRTASGDIVWHKP
jgi:hypothetical protein